MVFSISRIDKEFVEAKGPAAVTGKLSTKVAKLFEVKKFGKFNFDFPSQPKFV